jgi:glycosyltransferase involved in cell wall biosynthesis
MKVCHFTSVHKSNDIRIFHKECVSLAEAGHEVYLVATNTEEKKVSGVQILSVNVEYSGRISRMLKTSKNVYKRVLKVDADIYHFHDPELLRFGLKLKRKGKKVIYDAHEDVPRQIMAKYWIPKLFRKLISVCFERYENYVAKRLSAIVVSTPHIRDRFIKINPITIDVCNYPLVNELMEPSRWEDKKNEICYVGGISEVRGINQLMDSLVYTPEIRLNLAGSFSNEILEKQIRAKEKWNKVEFYGYVGREELLSIFERSKVGMVTLLPTPNHMESLPIKMFEYMSAGIPVICSNFPLWEEIVRSNKCGICVDPKDPEGIATAIEYLMKNQEESQQMGQHGRLSIKEKYNWDIEITKLLKVYNSL